MQSTSRPALFFLLMLSLTHAVVDLCAGAVMALLPALRLEYALSYTLVGMIPLFSNLTSSFTQPIFGYLSDKSQIRWLLPLSLALGGLGLGAVGFMPGYGLVVGAIILSALGTAAFHPEGAHAAHNLSGDRRATGMAIYSVGGNLGYALGPVVAGALVTSRGLKGTVWAAIPTVLLALWMMRLLPRWQATEKAAVAQSAKAHGAPGETNWKGTILLTILVIFRSVVNLGVTTYVPFFWIDTLGHDPATASWIQMTYLIAGVGGTLIGAPLADRYGTKKVLIGSFVALLPLQFLLPHLTGWAMLVDLFLAGFCVVSTFTVTLVMTQEYMPRSLGLASGLNLGLAFGLGGVGTLFLGMVADSWGVIAVLNTVAVLVIPTLLLAFILPPVQKGAEPKAAAAD